jgi:hypothetical protein|tara:strand:+ start:1566 stop:3071 length:1506 start_codon:yes stop_codon:yes gene_type:complete
MYKLSMSGRLQIATRGLQNEWINGTPTQSHFLFSLNKHSKFAFDTIELPLSGAEYDREAICVIPLGAGDLITKMTLRYQINFRQNQAGEQLRYTLAEFWALHNPAIHLIEYIDLFMGGMHIQRLPSDWIDACQTIQYEKTLNESNKESSNFVRAELEAGRDYATEPNLPPQYITIPFYFNDNLKSAILACKLTKGDCNVKIKFRKLSDVIRLVGANQEMINFFNGLTTAYGFIPQECYNLQERINFIDELVGKDVFISNASILTQYAYLDRNELQYLKSRPIEQIITQLQLKRFDVPKGETKRVQLNFKHPVKTLYFFVGPKSQQAFIAHGVEQFAEQQRLQALNQGFPGYPLNCTSDNIFGRTPIANANFMTNIRFSNAKLLFNNQIVFDDGPERLIYYNSKMNTMSGVHLLQEKKEIGSHSFALYPLEKEPSGHVNFSRIINQEFEITLPHHENISRFGLITDDTNLPFSTLSDINKCQVYAESYNILHYSSGLAGLKF